MLYVTYDPTQTNLSDMDLFVLFHLAGVLRALASEKMANDLLVEEQRSAQKRYHQMEQQLAADMDDRLMLQEELESTNVNKIISRISYLWIYMFLLPHRHVLRTTIQ